MKEKEGDEYLYFLYKIDEEGAIIPLFSEDRLKNYIRGCKRVSLQIMGKGNTLLEITTLADHIESYLSDETVDYEWFYYENNALQSNQLVCYPMTSPSNTSIYFKWE